MCDPAATRGMPTEPPSDPIPAAPTATDPDGHVRHDDATDTSGPEQRGAVPGDGAETEPDPESSAEAETGRNGNHGEADDVAALERRVADLEAELDAVRGLLDGVGAIDETVERRASAALAKAESVEERLDSGERGLVRERLPDDDRDQSAPDRRRTPRDRDPEPAARSDRAGSGTRADRGREGDDRPGRTEPGDRGPSAAPVDGADRTRAAESGATDDAAAGSGAISSVGSGAADAGRTATAAGGAGPAEPAEDADRSLAARLRDAFR